MQFNFSKENIAFQANGLTLRGWLYRPETQNKVPAIIMAHGMKDTNCICDLKAASTGKIG
jgi:poly(3-hydroxybutyrate) depolymerase